ncbi:hypothetical protein PRZ48_006350 [Zasmidium cellare]|uniref:Uncharacterized protein n=1 Tax=Zasmidium cellare TaxID=395010 RepID=A0ABR0EP07_ZASCE|nr:hypothetical protein PRZ48_006350 [Zasmidium cellare]
MPDWTKETQNPFSVFSAVRAPPQGSPRPPSLPDSSMERFLFHHYTTHVAKIMMPYDHPFNPWTKQYPAAALVCRESRDQALYDALLAHSAYNLSELYGKDCKMLYQATRHYDKALQKLLRKTTSKISDFATTFASILTLVLVEVYSGGSAKWRQHLQGANTLFRTAQSEMSGIDSVKTSVQSMHIILIIAQTSKQFSVDSHDPLPDLRATSDTPEFGFTIGASKDVLQCISKITELGRGIANGTPINTMMEELRSMKDFLEDDHTSQWMNKGRESNMLAQHQTLAFISATKIYLHRIIFNAPPKAVQLSVSSTLEQVLRFCKEDRQNNFSIWPAFIAAVEAYTEQDMQDAEKWLDWSSSFGMGNRTVIASVVREVWRRREEKSQLLDLDKGLTCVDWREVMSEHDNDVLLV